MKDKALHKSAISFISAGNLPNEMFCEAVKCTAFMIRAFYDMGYTHFLVGANTDYDEISADFVLSLKESHPEVTVEMVFGSYYKRKRFRKKGALSDSITMVSDNKFKCDIRAVEKYLAEHCDIAICCFPDKLSNDAFYSAYMKSGEKQFYNVVQRLCK